VGALEGRVAIITGAGRGLGRAHALLFAQEGAKVVVNDLGPEAEEVAAEIRAAGGEAVGVPADITAWETGARLVEAAVDGLGGLDVLVNNAGLGGTADLVDMTDEQWSVVLDVTLTGTFRMTRAALRQLRDQGRGGVIVNNASVLGWRAQEGQAHYAAAKAGVMALTRCAAVEAAAFGVRVNAVAPSLAMHPFLAKVTSDELLAELTQREVFGRAAEPWEVANVIVFLASAYSSYMTGEVVAVSSQHP
jgi:3-oxoacyl-[acyl-carrier protein] reductase